MPQRSAMAIPEGTSVRMQLFLLGVEKTPFFAPSVISSILTVVAPIHSGNSELLAVNPPLQWRAANIALSYCRYMEKLFWPENLAAECPLERRLPLGPALLAALFLMLVTSAAIGACWTNLPGCFQPLRTLNIATDLGR